MDNTIEPLKYKPRKNPHATQGIISLVLALIAWVAAGVLCLSAFGAGGDIGVYAGAIGLAVLLFSVIGFFYGIRGCMEEDRRHIAAFLGILLNGLLGVGAAVVFAMGMMQM